MTTEEQKFAAVCRVDEVPAGLGRGFVVGGHPVAVFRTRAGAVFATANACPHRGGPLADGMLAGEQVVCPMHAFRYDGATGGCDQNGACGVQTFPVEVTDGVVRVGVPAA